MSSSSVQVIGVGSPSGDDWVGWELAERLRNSEALAGWVDCLSVVLHDVPGVALSQAWRGGGLVILLDAVRSGAEPGTIHRFDTREVSGPPSTIPVRGSGVFDAIQLAAELDALPVAVVFYGVEIDPANTGMSMSDPVYAVLPDLVSEIEARLMAHLKQANPRP